MFNRTKALGIPIPIIIRGREPPSPFRQVPSTETPVSTTLSIVTSWFCLWISNAAHLSSQFQQ